MKESKMTGYDPSKKTDSHDTPWSFYALMALLGAALLVCLGMLFTL